MHLYSDRIYPDKREVIELRLVDMNISSIGTIGTIRGGLGNWDALGSRSVIRTDSLEAPRIGVSDWLIPRLVHD